MRYLLLTLVTFFYLTNTSVATIFHTFSFGDSPATIREKASSVCQLSPIIKNTRWNWQSHMKCSNFPYKGILATIYFQFSDNDLNRVAVISKDIPNYFLIRAPQNHYLISKNPSPSSSNNSSNLVDKLIFQDKVHYQQNGQKLTYFFYKGQWEWELIFEKPGYQKETLKKLKAARKKLQSKELKGWKTFLFGSSTSKIREQLEGLCKKISIDEKGVFQGLKLLKCHHFSFLNQKVDVIFKFYDLKLVSIDLQLPTALYPTLCPLLKKKYGVPYIEYLEDGDHFPYLIFPERHLELRHIVMFPTQKTKLSLQYIKKGYIDPVEKRKFKEKKDKKKLKKVKTRAEIIMDNL